MGRGRAPMLAAMAKNAHAPRIHLSEKLRNAARPAFPLLRALELWNTAGGTNMSAAVSFYGILSLAPLLLAIVAILGWWMDRTVLQDAIVRQLGGVIGAQGTAVISEALASAKDGSQGLVASIIAFVVLLSGATGVFGQLQTAFEQVWAQDRGLPPSKGWKHTVTLRVRGIGYILVFGFLLLVSLVISTMLSFFSGWGDGSLALEMVARILNEGVSFVVCAALFTGLMRLSDGPKPRLRFLVFGACIGGILFTIGRQLLALYLSGAAVVSAYGAAGSLIVLLMWIYFSSAVLLLGAASARALEDHVEARKSGEARLASGGSERRQKERRSGDRRHAPA
jgi:membrane protein